MIGFKWTVAKFFWYLFFMYFTFLYFTFYGMMAVGLTPSYPVASIVSSAFYNIWNLFSGFIIPRPVSVIIYCSISINCPCLHKCKMLSLIVKLIALFGMATCSESPHLVELVLLGMPCGMDAVWAGCVSVWGHHDTHGQRCPRECVRGEVLRLQAQLVGRGGRGGRGIRHLLCSPIRLRHHEAQSPEEVAMCSN